MNLNLCHKALNAEQIRSVDRYTIDHEPIASIDLMERASEAFVEKFLQTYPEKRKVLVFCGIGNNGGDGLVVSRLLLEKDIEVDIFIIGDFDKGSSDFKINHEIIKAYKTPAYLNLKNDFPVIEEDQVLIDAIFGSGLTRGVKGLYGDLIDHINTSIDTSVVALDIASGLGCNQLFDDGKVLNVSQTIAFQVPKLSHLLPQNEFYSGEVSLVDIGLDEEYINSLPSNYFQTTLGFIKSILKKRNKFLHKGQAGRDLIIAGSHGKMGAAVLSARACLKSGAGLLTTYLPKCGTSIMQTAIPEAMVMESSNERMIESIPDMSSFHAIGVGPGIGTDKKTVVALEKLIETSKVPLVIDADAINILSENTVLLKKLPADSILTPHPGEFERLVGSWSDDYERLQKQIDFANKYKVVVLLKGANTSIASSTGSVFFNPTGNPGMATAGSGDVLTGIITSFVGQGYTSIESAILGAYVHGLAGDIYSTDFSEPSLIASDIIDHLSSAFRMIHLSKP